MDGNNERVVVELIDVWKSFGDQSVLKGVNLSIKEGTTTVITGMSGGGKTLVLKHMMGLVRPDRGKVMVFDQDVGKMRRKELEKVRMDFGVLFQSAALFDSMTVYDNVALPLRERTLATEREIRENVEEKLGMMDLHGINEKYPAQLSGGMKKRVGLARALVLDPRIIFFDEPTTGLDTKRSSEIYRLFHKTQAQLGYTAVIVSHDVPKIFKLSDYVALLSEGVIQGYMTPEEFQLSSDPVIRAFAETTMGPIYSSEKEEPGFDETI